MNVIFLRNGADRDAARRAILDLIEETEGLLRIAVAYFNDLDIADALVKRAEQRRATRMIVNSSDLVRPVEGQVEYEVSAGLLRILGKARYPIPFEVRTLGLPWPDYHNMHHKFAVGDDRVLFGSLNWTRAALTANFEFVAVSEARADVIAFATEFDALWEAAHVIEGRGGQLRVIVCPNCRRSDSVDFESWGARCVNCMSEFRPRYSTG